jgi:hypothetical protein
LAGVNRLLTISRSWFLLLLGEAEHTAARKGLSLGCGGPLYFWRRLPICKTAVSPF